MRLNPYDDVLLKPVTVTSVAIQSLTSNTEVDSDSIDTALSFIAESIMVYVRTEIASTGTTSSIAWALQESNDNGVSDPFAAALDNTGTAIGGTLNTHTAAQDAYARVEGINLYGNTAAPHGGRKRYLRIAFTPAYTGSDPTTAVVALWVGTPASGQQLPVRTTVSNT